MKQLLTRYRILILIYLLILFACPALVDAAKKAPESSAAKPAAPTMPPFTLSIPPGWQLSHSGDCDTLTLYLRNQSDSLQQLFFFPRFGPVYMTLEQKTTDLQYETISGRGMSRRDMPVVDPLTPENFIRFMPQILQMKNMRDFMPDRPGIRSVEVISFTPQKKALEYEEARSAIIRILFVQDNRLGEGLIALTVLRSPEVRGAGVGMGYLLYGLTAPKGEFAKSLPALLDAGRSFKISQEYGKTCKKNRAEDLPVLVDEGQTLNPVLDSLASTWEKRTPNEDMLAEKKADSLRGVERLYHPTTGDVYEFPAGFSSAYLLQPQSYSQPDLKPLPDEPALWLKSPLNGSKLVNKK